MESLLLYAPAEISGDSAGKGPKPGESSPREEITRREEQVERNGWLSALHSDGHVCGWLLAVVFSMTILITYFPLFPAILWIVPIPDPIKYGGLLDFSRSSMHICRVFPNQFSLILLTLSFLVPLSPPSTMCDSIETRIRQSIPPLSDNPWLGLSASLFGDSGPIRPANELSGLCAYARVCLLCRTNPPGKRICFCHFPIDLCGRIIYETHIHRYRRHSAGPVVTSMSNVPNRVSSNDLSLPSFSVGGWAQY